MNRSYSLRFIVPNKNGGGLGHSLHHLGVDCFQALYRAIKKAGYKEIRAELEDIVMEKVVAKGRAIHPSEVGWLESKKDGHFHYKTDIPKSKRKNYKPVRD